MKATEVLGKHDLSRNEYAIDVLVEVLEGHSDRWARRNSADALGNQNLHLFPKAKAAILHSLHKDVDSGVRARAAEALGKQKEPSIHKEIIPQLTEALQRESDRETRQKVVLTLGKFDLSEYFPTLHLLLQVLVEDPFEYVNHLSMI